MEEQLGAKLVQLTLGLEGCHLLGPWGVARGLQTWLGVSPHAIQSLLYVRGHTPPGTPSLSWTPSFQPGPCRSPHPPGRSWARGRARGGGGGWCCIPKVNRARRADAGRASWKMATAPSSPSRDVGLPHRVSCVPARVELMLPSCKGVTSPDPQPSPAVAGTDCEREREG